MKKIIAAIAALFALTIFAGCNLTNDGDFDLSSPTVYFAGSDKISVNGTAITPWNPAATPDSMMKYNFATSMCELDNVKIPAGAEWKISLEPAWAGGKCVTLSKSSADYAEANGDNGDVANIVQQETGTYLVQYDPVKKEITLTAK